MPRKDADCWCNTVNGSYVTRDDGYHAAWCERMQALEAVVSAIGAIDASFLRHHSSGDLTRALAALPECAGWAFMQGAR